LNQKTLAERLGVSQGFLSSVINDQKVPGSEFLYTLKKLFGISSDWVLTGDGGMYGGSKINIQLQKEIQMYVAVARGAILDNDVTAQKTLSLLKENRLCSMDASREVKSFLDNISHHNEDMDAVTIIYNNNIFISETEVRKKKILEEAIQHFQLKKKIDIYSMNFDPDSIPVFRYE